MKKCQKGFSAVELLLIVVVISLLCFSGWYVYRTNHSTKKTVSVPATSKAGAISTNTSTTTQSVQTKPGPVTAPTASGIEGSVYCTDKLNKHPCTTDIEVRTYNTNTQSTIDTERIAAKGTTNADGQFKINVAPGSYNIVPAVKTGYPQFVPLLPNPVAVKQNQFTQIEIDYSDGRK